MFAVRMPDGCVGFCDGLLHEKQDSSIAFIAYFDRKGVKRVVGFSPEDLDYPFIGHVDMHFSSDDMTYKSYKTMVKAYEGASSV